MHEPQRHQMRLETTHSTGAEEWYCPTCKRRFLLRWPPAYERVILEAGDEYAIHTGGTADLSIEVSQTMIVESTHDDGDNPWIDWLQDVDLGDQ